MRRERSPDDRYQATLRSPHVPANPFEAALWQFKNQAAPDDVMERVVDVYEDHFEREILQAWIVAGAKDEDIHARGGVSLEILAPYRHLCCNILAFRDRLEMMRWVNMYKGSRSGKIMLERALHFDGIEAIAHLSGRQTSLSPDHVNEQAMRESYFRGVSTLRASSISGPDAMAAHQLMKTATTTAAAVANRGAPNMAETMLKLKHREVTWHVEDIMPHGEILH
jgi:hypothetical protein